MAVALVVVAGLQERAAVASRKEGSKLVPTLVVTCTVLISGPGRQVALPLFAVLPRKVEEPVRVESVGQHLIFKMIIQPFASRHLRDLGLDLAGLFQRPPFAPGERFDGTRIGVGGQIGVELETAPDDLHLASLFKLCQCALKSAFADVTKRAGNVRPNFDCHLRKSFFRRKILNFKALKGNKRRKKLPTCSIP